LPKKKTQKTCQILPQFLGAKKKILSYFEYFQIWLKILMDDRQLSNITKLKK
jgi:hypothetical protein